MRSSPDRTRYPWLLPTAVVLGGLLGWLLPENGRLENAVNRAWPSPLDDRLVLIGIDDASLRDYGRMDVWPRELYAAALGTLREAGVKAVGLDVILSAPSSGDGPLASTFNHDNVVLATAPDDALNPYPQGWTAPTGVSALNSPSFGAVREVQTAYPALDATTLVPSFARQVAAQTGPALPLSTTPHLIRYTSESQIEARTLSFRDVVNGNVRFADLQGKVAVIGLTAHGLGNMLLPDLNARPVPGSVLQLRAISSLLSAPLTRLPTWLTVLLCSLTAALAVWARGLWGFVLAAAVLLLALPAWKFNLVFPGVTVSFAALLGSGLVALEQWWRQRQLSTQDWLTGFGKRLAFTRAVEQRWAKRHERPLSLLLIDIDNLRQVQELRGRLVGETTLREVANRLQETKRRGDLTFRWGAEEFAVLLDQTAAQELEDSIRHYQSGLQNLAIDGTAIHMNIGGATTSFEHLSPADLIEAASRSRYRMKYQRELQANVKKTE